MRLFAEPVTREHECVLLPYDRGDLVSRIHDKGEVVSTDHTGEGTVVQARVSEALAAELEPYAIAGAATSEG